MEQFRVRLNCVDHYQAVPSEYDPQIWTAQRSHGDQERPTIPVMRVFGTTETGQKVCAHVHGILPYLYIEYDGEWKEDQVNAYIFRLRMSIDHALSVSYRRPPSERRPRFVAHISVVQGVPFYGYHVGLRLFLKIYLLNPLYINRLADLLRQGAVMQKALQPFESHMQYVPQWMCDYNLFGCQFLEVSQVTFRGPVPEAEAAIEQGHQWHDGTIPEAIISDSANVLRQSHCTLEVDICAQDILNRLDVKSRDIHHDLIEKHTLFNGEDKVVTSMAGLWKDETKRRKLRMGLKDSDNSPFPPEVLVTISADSRDVASRGWIHEREYEAKLNALADSETDYCLGPNHITGFINQPNTALESVEDFFPENEAKNRANGCPIFAETIGDQQSDQVDVDEERVLSLQQEYEDYKGDDDFLLTLQEHPEEELIEPSIENPDSTVKDATENLPSRFNFPAAQIQQGQHEDSAGIIRDEEDFHSLGVREPSNYENTQNDAFHVPLGFTSKIQTSFTRNLESKVKDKSEVLSSKKRKLYVKENPLGQTETDLNESKNVQDHSGSDRPDEAVDSLERPIRNGSSNLKNSQTSTLRDARYNFPSVKNPHDPLTIARLSQRSRRSSSAMKHSNDKSNSSDGKGSPATSSLEQKSSSKSALVNPDSQRRTISLASMLPGSFSNVKGGKVLCIHASAPRVPIPMSKDAIPSALYQGAYYSDENDVPERGREYAGREFRLESSTVPFLADFDSTGTKESSFGVKPAKLNSIKAQKAAMASSRATCTLSTWEYDLAPPSRQEVVEWMSDSAQPRVGSMASHGNDKRILSQIDVPTQKNKHGTKYSQKQKSSSVSWDTQYMSVMSLEIHANTRGQLSPDPEQDQIECIFWCLQTDSTTAKTSDGRPTRMTGIICLSEKPGLSKTIKVPDVSTIEEEASELDLITNLVDFVRTLDPDILAGFEVHGSSWGYVIERARLRYDYNLCDELSRMKSQSHGRFGKEADRWGFNNTSTIRVTGRHMINIWRAMRGELNLLQYTLENITFHLLQRRVPHYTFSDLTRWYKSNRPQDLAKVLGYHRSRVQLDLEILEESELVPRTSEQARLLGVDFYSVFSRGSQFKVESLMFRIAKPENFILISPSRKQVGQQNALECLPLVMEPQSAFYSSPVLVLDFQSLYPSVMIAYNYCYSTFLGRVVQWRGQNKMGFTDYAREPGLISALREKINISPNGMMYSKPEVRKSLLAKMLGEILETRVMVKSGMKVDKGDRHLQRLLNNRQLALKLIANVTYGYTSASFSGRMPCSEIADSIVQTGRETLEKAIAMIHSVEKWGAEVVYGDTDSLFVHLKGRTRDEAFEIGQDIADTITSMNPKPMKLKFEKVYHPCFLIAKKRYVGYKYESRDQKTPEFDAKGIETVRRDGTPAEQKIEEAALKMMFESADLSLVKRFFQRQCMKIMKSRVSIQDFCFAKEVKLGTYSDKGAPPPGALISARRMLEDPRTEPQYGERVPYVVITGAPGARLIDRCVAPDVLLGDDQNELDAEYYISKNIIPPLERIFNLVGANIRQWYEEMPKYQKIRRVEAAAASALGKGSVLARKTLESYMTLSTCIVCKCKVESPVPLCEPCQQQPSVSIMALSNMVRAAETKAADLHRICRSCASLPFAEEVRCDNKDCPVLFSRIKADAEVRRKRLAAKSLVGALEETRETELDW